MSMLDMVLFILMLFVFSISVFFGSVLLEDFQEETADMFPERARNITAVGIAAFQGFDYGFLFLMGGLFIAIIIGAFLIPTHPVFFIISVFVFMIVLVVVPQISNMFLEVSEQPALSNATASFPMIVNAWGIMPYVGLVFGALLLIIMFSRLSGGGGIRT